MAEYVVETAPANNLGSGKSGDSLGCMVPIKDAAVRVDEIDRIVKLIQEHLIELRVIFEKLLGEVR
jgi:hypothetical protein